MDFQPEAMPVFFYTQWYDEDVKKNLTQEQKKKLMMKISDYSLSHNITTAGSKVSLNEFPELAKFAHTKELSGLQLYAVQKELFKEFHPAMAKQIFKDDMPALKRKKMRDVS